MKKKVLKDVLIFIALIIVLTLTGCEKKEEKIQEAKTVKLPKAIEYYEIEKKEVSVTNETNKWPSGVYDVYGIPKCTSGKLGQGQHSYIQMRQYYRVAHTLHPKFVFQSRYRLCSFLP